MSASAPSSENQGVSGFPEVSFGRSADGLRVALVGETAFAMADAGDGKHYLVTGWRIRKPFAEWTRSDFYGYCGELADEASFRAKVEENAEHQREKRTLARRETRSTANTPWGPSQGATVFAKGVICHSTAGHGGFHLSPERNGKVHAGLRAADGFYEEHECWAIVAFTFPHLFTSFERRCAERTMKDSFPDAWEAITGNVLQSGESWKKDERTFLAGHGADWIVVSAIASDHEKGFVEVIATRGGRRDVGTEERRFLVPSDEYRIGRFGFVIDPERHQVYDGPSSFVGWQGRRAS
ncbi:hypothetical protein [Mesorhizobium sp.]|uniref:DUF7007 domain-containing protein n=1 Tax=Mesorhizobium sp. TaxID=1871066 RepID=UPI000FD20D25|nr:hypothetical protein [Mesorhizobium sp.]RUV55531.1 hypothetical protein EOA88_35800 [Mesorhizobium sp. M5C.F.Ca.IN.020.14.1.1]RWI34066.1 MAG: hypothetical protein EOR14_31895 [Mesorhizobium sp.]RWI63615.1 MAG: hypothetical protein EOR17_28030 [Mesorhizobium sp.]RWJ25305.1 MAG: hypothetical protein EOR28_28300 [Mesorhizobium sp.]TIQ70055.1 MAG: hypothetical protein E5X40_24180 [Mesorhizobium sp.]